MSKHLGEFRINDGDLIVEADWTPDQFIANECEVTMTFIKDKEKTIKHTTTYNPEKFIMHIEANFQDLFGDKNENN